MTNLKPCPHCGGECDVVTQHPLKRTFLCKSCGFISIWSGTESEAIAAHNRRVVSPLERIGELTVEKVIAHNAYWHATKMGKEEFETDELNLAIIRSSKTLYDAIDAYLAEG